MFGVQFISARPPNWHDAKLLLLFSGCFYQIFNLILFMSIYHYFGTVTTAAYFVYY